MIFSLRTTVGQEDLVIDIVSSKVRKEILNIYSISVLPGLKGYILIEADNEITVQRAIIDVPSIKGGGVVGLNKRKHTIGGITETESYYNVIKIEELSNLLEAKPLMQTIKEGQKVELIAGPFKGEKARVIRVNPAKEEVTVELLEAAVKIPVTIHAEHIRILPD